MEGLVFVEEVLMLIEAIKILLLLMDLEFVEEVPMILAVWRLPTLIPDPLHPLFILDIANTHTLQIYHHAICFG